MLAIFLKFLCGCIIIGALNAGFWSVLLTVIVDLFIFKIYVSKVCSGTKEECESIAAFFKFVSVIAMIIGVVMFIKGIDSGERVLSRDPCGICGGTRVFLGELCKNCYGSGRETVTISPRYTWIGCLIAVSGGLFFYLGKLGSDSISQTASTPVKKSNSVQNYYRSEAENKYHQERTAPQYVVEKKESISNGVPIFRCKVCGRPQNLNKNVSVVKCIYCGTSHSVSQFETVEPNNGI